MLYNDLTGDTHLVDAFTLELLELLRAAPMPAAALAAALDADVSATGDEAGHAQAAWLPEDLLATVLADLAALHLIEATSC